MICPNCNKELNTTTGFCPYCGSSLNNNPNNNTTNNVNPNPTFNTSMPTTNQVPVNQPNNGFNNYQSNQGFNQNQGQFSNNSYNQNQGPVPNNNYNQNTPESPKKKNPVFIIIAVIVIIVIVIMSITKKVNTAIDKKKSKESEPFDIYEVVEVPEEKTEGFDISSYKDYEHIGIVDVDMDSNHGVSSQAIGWRMKIVVPITQRIEYKHSKLFVEDYNFSASYVCDFEHNYNYFDYYKKVTPRRNSSYIVYRNKNSDTVDVTVCYEKLNNKASYEDIKLNIEFSEPKERISQLQSNAEFLELAEIYNIDSADLINEMKIASEKTGIYNAEETLEEKDTKPTVDPKTNLSYTEKGAFLMYINDVWKRIGKGTLAVGTIKRGTVKVGDKVQLVGLDQKIIETKVAKIEKLREKEDAKSAKVGDYVGIILDKVTANIENGQVIAQKNSITTSKSIEVELYIYTESERGLESPLTKTDYEMSMIYNECHYRVKLKLPEGKTDLVPGETVKVTIEGKVAIPAEVGDEFTLLLSTLRLGKGKITKIN